MHREPTAISLVAIATPSMPVRSHRPITENVVNSMPRSITVLRGLRGALARRPQGAELGELGLSQHAQRFVPLIAMGLERVDGGLGDGEIPEPLLVRGDDVPRRVL